jgi:hypothetical protein
MRSKFYSRYFRFCILAVLFALPAVGYGQGVSLPIPDRNSKEWRRINTDKLNHRRRSRHLDPGTERILRATYRISLSKSEDARKSRS